jgi:hypothetical protein
MRLAKRYRFYFLDEPLTYYRVTETGAFLRSAEAAGVNMLRLLDSHFDKIGSKSAEVKARIGRRRSAVMCAAGRMFHHNREFARSREWYLKAIGENPSNYKAYVGLAAALAGVRIIYR